MTPAERKAAQQAEAQRQCEADEAIVMRYGRPTAFTMLAMHDAETGRGMRRVTFDDLMAEVRIGPGPDRPVAHQN